MDLYRTNNHSNTQPTLDNPHTRNLALTMEQMRHLEELGFNTESASMVYHPSSYHSQIFTLRTSTISFSREFWNNEKRKAIAGDDIYERLHGRDVFAFTAADLMGMLPSSIKIKGCTYKLTLTTSHEDDILVFHVAYGPVKCTGTFPLQSDEIRWDSTILVQALHSALLWLVKTKRVRPKSMKIRTI